MAALTASALAAAVCGAGGAAASSIQLCDGATCGAWPDYPTTIHFTGPPDSTGYVVKVTSKWYEQDAINGTYGTTGDPTTKVQQIALQKNNGSYWTCVSFNVTEGPANGQRIYIVSSADEDHPGTWTQQPPNQTCQ